jgi:hypothetical protein
VAAIGAPDLEPKERKMQIHEGTPGSARRSPEPTGDPLPSAARAKFLALQGMATEARDLAASAQGRLRALQDELNSDTLPDGQLTGIEREVERLIAVRTKQNERHALLLELVNNVRRYIQAMPPGGVSLEAIKQPAPKLLKGESLNDALTRVRDQITAVKGHRYAVASAAPPKAVRKEAARRYVDEMAKLGAPNITIRDGKFEVAFGAGTAKSFVPQSVKGAAQLFAWIDPAAFLKRLTDAIDAMPEPVHVMDTDERDRRILTLTSDLEKLEIEEESIVEAAADDGIEVLRRPDASPAAVLGVRTRQRKRERVV